ncbi:unnamed protein product [Knipowitschia caucasica]
MYARAVWVEKGKEMEGTVPFNWVKGNQIFWPRQKAQSAFKAKINPGDDWLSFPLIKIKVTSDNLQECESYALTSQQEEEEEEGGCKEIILPVSFLSRWKLTGSFLSRRGKLSLDCNNFVIFFLIFL